LTSTGNTEMGHEYFCIYTNADETEETSVDEAKLAVIGWVDKIN